YIVLISVFCFGIWRILEAVWTFKEARRPPQPAIWVPRFQVTAWAGSILASIAAFLTGHAFFGVVVLLIAVTLPIRKGAKAPKGAEDWPDAGPVSTDKPAEPEVGAL